MRQRGLEEVSGDLSRMDVTFFLGEGFFFFFAILVLLEEKVGDILMSAAEAFNAFLCLL